MVISNSPIIPVVIIKEEEEEEGVLPLRMLAMDSKVTEFHLHPSPRLDFLLKGALLMAMVVLPITLQKYVTIFRMIHDECNSIILHVNFLKLKK